jgi:hypothetical protein
MAIYNSNSLGRSVLTEELPNMQPQELRKFYDELISCIDEITTQIEEVSSFETKYGHKPDQQWEYRAKKKLRISMQFATKVEAINKPLPKSYDQRYQDHFMRILLEELGPTALKKIQAEASTIARSESNE